jgi:DNA-directed RNA polymerase subunit RPC12/RpoP
MFHLIRGTWFVDCKYCGEKMEAHMGYEYICEKCGKKFYATRPNYVYSSEMRDK